MIDITGLREDKRPQSSTIVHALLDRLEAAESDAAHQKALAESALRVAEGWERKCGELRAKIEHMENQEPVAWRTFDGEGGYEFRSYEWNENYKLEWDARNPNHAGWVEPLYALPVAQPSPSFADAYQGAMEEVAIWKKRALEAEDLNRKFVAEINGPTYMGEPAQPAPSVPEVTDAMIEVIESRAEQSYRRHHGSARGQQITPADALSWHIIHATREVLSAAPEVKP